jgi:hypothetical protein
MKMESNQSSAICFKRFAVPIRPWAASTRNPSQYGDEFTRHATAVIESAIENLTRFDDLATNERLQASLQSKMSSTQIDEARRVFQSDMLELEGNAVSSTHVPEYGACAAGPGPAWINTLV